jgi:hypothetical protein
MPFSSFGEVKELTALPPDPARSCNALVTATIDGLCALQAP